MCDEFNGERHTHILPKPEVSPIVRFLALAPERRPKHQYLISRLSSPSEGQSPCSPHGLTTLETLGDAPRCRRFFTMGRCPMKEATWRGVKPDWNTQERNENRGAFPAPTKKRQPDESSAFLFLGAAKWFSKQRELNEMGLLPGKWLEGKKVTAG